MIYDTSPEANAYPSQAGASQQACLQAPSDDRDTGVPGDSAVPTRLPTRSMRERERKREGAQYNGAGEGVGGTDRTSEYKAVTSC